MKSPLLYILAYASLACAARADLFDRLPLLEEDAALAASSAPRVARGETVRAFDVPKPRAPRTFAITAPRFSAVVMVDAPTLERKLADALSHRYQAVGQVVIRLAREWKPLTVPADWELRLSQVAPDQLTSSAFARFSLWGNGRMLGEYGFPFKAAHMVNVSVAKAPLARGMRPAPEYFETRSVDSFSAPAFGHVPRSSPLTGYQLASAMQPGDLLKWSKLGKVTLVRRGDMVKVYAQGKGIFVEMTGLAQEDGVKDQFIRILNVSNPDKREFQAKVLDENRVKVQL